MSKELEEIRQRVHQVNQDLLVLGFSWEYIEEFWQKSILIGRMTSQNSIILIENSRGRNSIYRMKYSDLKELFDRLSKSSIKSQEDFKEITEKIKELKAMSNYKKRSVIPPKFYKSFKY